MLQNKLMDEPTSIQIDYRIQWLEAYYSTNKTEWITSLIAYIHTGTTKLDQDGILVRHLDNLSNTFGQQALRSYLEDIYPMYFIKGA